MTTTSKRHTWSRWAGLGLAATMLLALSGDGIGAGISPHGIDPLDVLDLQVKPNVIVVLDSSGSMQESLGRDASGNSPAWNADWQQAKMSVAKTVLSATIQANSTKASFLFGQYTQNTSTMQQVDLNVDNRFMYLTAADATATPSGLAPSMLTACASPYTTACELTLNREPGSPFGNSITIGATNNRVEWTERVDATAGRLTYAYCAATLTNATYTGDTGMAALAADITAKMVPGACIKYSCTGPPACAMSATAVGNTFTATWNAAAATFRLTRGGANVLYQMRFAAPNSVAATLGFPAANIPGGITTPGPLAANITAATMAAAQWSNNGTVITGAALGTPTTGSVASRGFQAWQWITTSWNRLYFREGATTCTAIITPQFYARGGDLATEIAAKMNACARPAPRNTYVVTYNVANGRFTFLGPTNGFTLLWNSGGTANIAGALSNWSGTTGAPRHATFTDATATAATAWQTLNDSLQLLRRATGNKATEVGFDPDGAGPQPARNRTTYNWIANKFFNGELFYVRGDGTLCGFDPTSPVKTNQPTIRMQQVSDCANLTGTTVGPVVPIYFGGGAYGGNSISCNGFQTDVALGACDGASNVATILPFLEKEFPIDGVSASATFGAIKTYQEFQDGTYAIQTLPAAGGIHADGSTPIANSLISIRTIFGTTTATGLWGFGQATPPRGPIRNQASPRERTIVMFVTDGDDTCANGGSGNDDNALRAAHKAQQLFTAIEPTKPESSVSTYMIGLGSGASTNRLNWIAWGGSGMGQGQPGQPAVTTTGAAAAQRWDGAVETPTALTTKRANCTTCVDAYFAPDADTLAAQLQSILDQGASSGEFTAQQSVFTPVMELVKEVVISGSNPFDPEAPQTRYNGIVPEIFRSTFTMPSFKGQLKAFQNDTGNVALKWNAGTKLFNRVSTAIGTCPAGSGAVAGECPFSALLTKIDRRVYTTSRNGVFGATVANLTDISWLNGNGNRTVLWPAPTTVAPASDAALGILDAALGLPLTNDDPTFATLQSTYQTCLGTPLPAGCTAAQPLKTQRARREAREMILSFMAGAKISITAASVPKRQTGTGELLYVTRDWMLADSTLATPAVIGQPIEPEPTGSGFEVEYRLFRDGLRDVDNKIVGDATDIGFGLRNPDKDANHTTTAPASDVPNLKPAMTVIYAAANDMLHAFRAGPNCSIPAPYELPPGTTNPPFSGFRYNACAEKGGEELWGFVPYDQLDKLRQRMATQTRANHTYMIAAGLRFGDIFVPNPGTAVDRDGTTTNFTMGAASASLQGVWRRVLIFGRGIAGKYLTVLDVTTPGDFKTLAKNTIPPVVYWSRGNRDTNDGTTSGTSNGTAPDRVFYSRMGETWSVPTLAFVDRAATSSAGGLANATVRKPTGIDFVLYVGSGYGDTSGCPSSSPCEGQTFYTLDALTGDVIAAAAIPAASGTPKGGYANALVANASAYNPNEFVAAVKVTSSHPAASKTDRVYIGDLHGRVWKFLSNDPGTPLLVTDLGINQPIATPVSLLGFDEGGAQPVPYVYVTSGFDNREDPAASPTEAFMIAGIKDNDTAALSPTDACRQDPVVPPCVFERDLTQDFGGVTGYFRGTVQPASLFTSDKPPLGRVFFGGTRFNPPNSTFAPPPCTGLGCNPVVPCRSSFDSIIFALGAKSGLAAFDLNDGAADDSYVVFDNSKIAGIGVFATTDSGGQLQESLYVDEGLNRDTGTAEGSKPRPETLPQKGKAPSQGGNGSVLTLELRSSSTICQ